MKKTIKALKDAEQYMDMETKVPERATRKAIILNLLKSAQKDLRKMIKAYK